LSGGYPENLEVCHMDNIFPNDLIKSKIHTITSN